MLFLYREQKEIIVIFIRKIKIKKERECEKEESAKEQRTDASLLRRDKVYLLPGLTVGIQNQIFEAASQIDKSLSHRGRRPSGDSSHLASVPPWPCPPPEEINKRGRGGRERIRVPSSQWTEEYKGWLRRLVNFPSFLLRRGGRRRRGHGQAAQGLPSLERQQRT
jgi:hypothetical protein